VPRGFSLVETIFAIALLTGALVTLAQLVAAGVQTTAAAQYRTIATVLAQRKLEELRGESTLGDVSDAIEHRDANGVQVCVGPQPCAAAVFSVRWSIAPSASTPGAVLIQVSAAHAHRHHARVNLFGIRPRSIR
jgi:Tfp pilus assembly protein PilV